MSNEVHKTTLLDRLKNAYRAFCGREIGSLQFGIDVKRCDECVMDASRRVFYLCDQKACTKCSYPTCRHTDKITHAINFEPGYNNSFWEKGEPSRN